MTPEEAAQLLAEGCPYLDVRTVEEFAEGHVPGALNVPLHLRGQSGLSPNPDFTNVALGILRPLGRAIVGCRSGQRSLVAIDLLAPRLPFELYHLDCGFEGRRDAFGRATPGWKQQAPVEATATGAQLYETLRERVLGPLSS